MDDLDRAVLNAATEALDDESIERLVVVAGHKEGGDAAREFITARIERLKAEKRRAVAIALKTDDPDVAAAVESTTAAVKKAEADLAALPTAPTTPEALRDALRRRAEDWRSRVLGEMNVARAAVRALVDPIVISSASFRNAAGELVDPDPQKERPSFAVEITNSQVVVAEGLIPAVHEYTSGAPV